MTEETKAPATEQSAAPQPQRGRGPRRDGGKPRGERKENKE